MLLIGLYCCLLCDVCVWLVVWIGCWYAMYDLSCVVLLMRCVLSCGLLCVVPVCKCVVVVCMVV